MSFSPAGRANSASLDPSTGVEDPLRGGEIEKWGKGRGKKRKGREKTLPTPQNNLVTVLY